MVMSSSKKNVAAESEVVESDEDEEAEWEDWAEGGGGKEGLGEANEEGDCAQCFFCEEKRNSAAQIFAHCAVEHSFDFLKLRRYHRIGFYDTIRFINFIRSRVNVNECWSCGSSHGTNEALLEHLKVANHEGLPPFLSGGGSSHCSRLSASGGGEESELTWGEDDYLTPFWDSDPLLYNFDDGEDEDFGNFDPVRSGKVTAEVVIDLPVMADVNGSSFHNDEGHESCEHFTSDLTQSFRGLMQPAVSGSAPDNVTATIVEAISESEELQDDDDDEDDEASLELEILSHGASATQSESGSEGRNELHDIGDVASIIQVSTERPAPRKKKSKVTFAMVAEKEKLSINRSYFGSYSAFGIHREMLSDRVRTEAYEQAILNNPSLLRGAVVMDLGCGTGILSLFAAKAGALKVIAVDGSEKMTAVASQVREVECTSFASTQSPCDFTPQECQVAKANGFLEDSSISGESAQNSSGGVIRVVAGMIEELDSSIPTKEHSVDVLVSEWMGYCLLYESMLGSVLYARDKWLKPGGALLPDTADMYLAGFGRGGTSLCFWENVYGFDMRCVGEEVLYDAAQHPIIDVLDCRDVITDSCHIKAFDLVNMKHEDVDFTAEFQVQLLPFACNPPPCLSDMESQKREIEGIEERDCSGDAVWCYGLVVWFDTGFTSRFCRDSPVVLSTSPCSHKTHWSQTILTFREPIALSKLVNPLETRSLEKDDVCKDQVESLATGKDDVCKEPVESVATGIAGRISIARSHRHRSIDISLETSATGPSGIIRSWPVQMFDI